MNYKNTNNDTKKEPQQQLPEKFRYWKGIPRETIEWNPTIDPSKCVGCGMCVVSCGRKVFDFDPQNNKAVVARPYQCMVGCTSCRIWCVFDAISFPDEKKVKELIKQKGVLVKAKKELEERLNKA